MVIANYGTSVTGNPAGAVTARDEESLLRLYIGWNAERYISIYRAPRKSPIHYWRAFSITAFVFSYAWCFYRKLYLEGCIVILVPILFVYLFPDYTGPVVLFWVFAIAQNANRYYVDRAIKEIRHIESQPLVQDERDNLIRSTGGISNLGSVVGTITYIAVLGFSVVANKELLAKAFPDVFAEKTLPICDSNEAVTKVREAAVQRLSAQNWKTEYLTFKDFEALENANSDARPCRFTLAVAGQDVPLRFDIFWVDANKKDFQVNISPIPR